MLSIIALLAVVSCAAVLVNMNVTFEEHFGKVNWEEMKEVANERSAEVLVGLNIAVWCVVGLFIVWFVSYIFYIYRQGRRELKLEREVLARFEVKKEAKV